MYYVICSSIMATGGLPDPEELHDTADIESQMDALIKVMSKLSDAERRHTLASITKSLDNSGKEGKSQSEGKSLQSKQSRDNTERDCAIQTVNASSNIMINNVSRKIRSFTGKPPSNAGETDFKRWRRSAMSIALDPELTTNQKRTYLLQSLTGPAEDAVELVRNKSPVEIIQFLKSVWERRGWTQQVG